MVMDQESSPKEGIDLTKPISNWFKPNSNENASYSRGLGGSLLSERRHTGKCKSIVGCTSTGLKGFDYCHKHILEDKTSPFRRCSFISKSEHKRCRNPTPVNSEKRTYCMMHDKERKRENNKNKKKKKPTSPRENSNRKRPCTLPVPVATNEKKRVSSDEDDSNVTDVDDTKRTDCLWFGNQVSDAESTDSEDENLLNHAGVWTLEEVLGILKQKMIRLRYLYSLQYKRMNYRLKEERRKMLKDYDMDPVTLAKVGFNGCNNESFERYVADVQLDNYQRLCGSELVAEKLYKEKRSKGLSLGSRKNDLPKCTFYDNNNQRCQNKMLPSLKFCYNHVTRDHEQYLFSTCMFRSVENVRCTEPAETFSSYCVYHPTLSKEPAYEKAFNLFQSAKQRVENRRRKILEKEVERKEPRRSSARLKDCVHSSTNSSTHSGDVKGDEERTLLEIKRELRNLRTRDGLGSGCSSPRDGNIFEKIGQHQ